MKFWDSGYGDIVLVEPKSPYKIAKITKPDKQDTYIGNTINVIEFEINYNKKHVFADSTGYIENTINIEIITVNSQERCLSYRKNENWLQVSPDLSVFGSR